MFDYTFQSENFAGNLLIAHPSLSDPHFQQSIVLISADSLEKGVMGVVINRPLKHKLSDVDPNLKGDPLGDTPLYAGGPVSSQEIIMTAWEEVMFGSEVKVHFGITLEQARKLNNEGRVKQMVAYLGYSGWSHDQLVEELDSKFWVQSSIQNLSMIEEPSEKLWKAMFLQACPEYNIFTKAPDDPSLN